MSILIDNIINDLSKKDGKLTVFCGAGISINSGLPAAIALLEEILKILEIEPEDKPKLIRPDWKLAMPFEMFFETFLENTDQHQILHLFEEGKPSTNHFLLSKCYRHGLLTEIYTTNFDLLIEKAFEWDKQRIFVYRDEGDFVRIGPYSESEECRLVKVHGSIDNIDSIRATLTTITNKQLTEEREKVLDRVFASRDALRRVLIFGYSCSDIFDVIPKIEKVFRPQVEVFMIEHHKYITQKEEVVVEDISIQAENNPFKRYRGKRIKAHTDSFVRWFWEKLDDDYRNITDFNDNWKKYVLEWAGAFHSRYLKFTIIGQLFYRIADYAMALKYHQRALTANEHHHKRGEGASYSNIGLIYHDLKQYETAIAYFEQAAVIFNEIDFFYGIAAAYTNKGYSYIYIPNKIKAILNLKKSLQISRKKEFRENKLCEADALSNLGLLYEKESEYQNAIYYYTAALDIDKLGNKSGEAEALSDLARVYKLLGNLREAAKLFKTSNEIACKLGMQSLIAYTSEQMAELNSMASTRVKESG